MPSTTPFVDSTDWTIDLRQILAEAAPLAALVGLVGFVALVPLLIVTYVGVFPFLLTIVSQFLFAVGAGIVLLYVITRSIELANE